jgi:nucleotide-binding universal stress UspA family protein
MKTIVVAIDFSSVTDSMLDAAIRLARAFGGKLCLVHVEPPDPSFVGYEAGPQTVRDAVAEEFREEHRKLHALQKRVEEQGVEATSQFIQGPTIEKILEEADRLKADLIVMGSHGHGALYHLLVGSVSEGVLRKAKCPVLVVPSPRDAG